MTEFRHYFSFKGRATRQEFWRMKLWSLGSIFLANIFLVTTSHVEPGHSPAMFALFFFLFLLLGLWIEFAVAVRRGHDLGWSGWWLFGYYPWLGFVRGTIGPNEFGPDPLSS